LCGRHAEAHLSKQSRARPGKKHSRKKQATGNGRSEATHTVDYERIAALLSQRYPPDKLDVMRLLIESSILTYQDELAWSRHRLKIRGGLDKLKKMLDDQCVAIEQIGSIAPHQLWEESLYTEATGFPGVITSLPDAMVGLGRLLIRARNQLTPKPGPNLAGRELVARLIITIEAYADAGQRIGHSYKDDLAPLLKQIVKAVDPMIGPGTIDETLRARARGEDLKLLPVWECTRHF
jgi:hypothetical protein